jgi:hypothetical protein
MRGRRRGVNDGRVVVVVVVMVTGEWVCIAKRFCPVHGVFICEAVVLAACALALSTL